MKPISTDRLLTLGMALYADKRTMEQRVRGIFGRTHSSGLALVLAAVLCLLVGVTCFTTACMPVREAASSTSDMPRAEDTVSGFGLLSLAALGRPDVDIRYSAEYAEPGAPARDEKSTVTPKQAVLVGANMLLRVFGEEAVYDRTIGVRYREDSDKRPWYEVYVDGSGMDAAIYAATVDAQNGTATYCGYGLPDAPGEAATGDFDWSRVDRDSVEQACLAAADAWQRMLYGEDGANSQNGFYDGTIEPCIIEPYELRCRFPVHTGSMEDFELTYLYDLDDADAPPKLVSASVIYVREDNVILDAEALNGETYFTRARIAHIYRVLCGDAPPMQYAETQAETRAAVEAGRKALALAKTHPNEAWTESVMNQWRGNRQLENAKQALDELETRIPELPEARLPADLDLLAAYPNATVHVSLGAPTAASFGVHNGNHNTIYFNNLGLCGLSDTPLSEPLTLTREQAEAAAKQLLADCGAEDAYVLAEVTEEDIAGAYGSYVDDAYKPRAWRLIYLTEGSPLLREAHPQMHLSQTNAYISLLLGDNGILQFRWNVPKSVSFSW